MQLDEALVPIDTEFGTWPGATDSKFEEVRPGHFVTAFNAGPMVVTIEFVGSTLLFKTIKSTAARAFAKTSLQLSDVASTTPHSGIRVFSQVAEVFGKVMFIVLKYLKDNKPKTVDFSGLDGVGSLYNRAMRSPASTKEFNKLGYEMKFEGEEDIAGQSNRKFSLIRKD